MLGDASFQEGLYKESIAHCETANNEFSQNSAAYAMIAKNYLKLGDFKSALSNMGTAVVLKQPKLSQEYVQLATIYKAMNDDKKVLEYLNKAKPEDPKDPMIAY
jgi:tetratricopeptide (TPR) repeat protein